jgi:hypothetical protein
MASDRLAARYERDMVKIFRRHWATSAPAARRLRDLGIKDSSVLQGLLASTVLRRAGPERYFLHEPTWAARNQMSWSTLARVGVLLVVIAIGVVVLLSRSGG